MSYQALARKWRPRNFADLVGQTHVVPALSNALTRNQLHHAYLFTGTRGVGKTTLARIFAKCLNCEQNTAPTPIPCGTCSTCKEIDEGRFVDLLEVDAASRTKVDQTRELLDNVPYAPARGRYKVYLIDEVHMFSASSFNALLKTLEEPPPHVKFLLATTNPQKLPITVLSRCLQFNLKRLSTTQIRGQLLKILTAEGISHEAEALWPLAQGADGSMRDGLSLLDQAIAFGGGQVAEAAVRAMLGTLTSGMILDLGEALASGSPAQVLQVVALMAEHTPDFSKVLADMLNLLHDLAIGQAVPEYLQAEESDNPRKLNLARTLATEDIQLFYQIGILGQRDLELAPDPRMGLEMVLLRMLAFRPAGQPSQPVVRPSTPAPQPPKIQRPPVQPTAPQPPNLQQPPVAPRQNSQPTATVASPTPVAPQVTSRLASNEDWHDLVKHLKLRGLAGELANNCEFGSWNGRTLNLRLDAAMASLKVVNTEERILNALRQQLGPETQINLRITRIAAETPAQRGAHEQQQRQQEQQSAFMEDPAVRALQDTFQAELMPGSIRPED